MGMVFQAEDVHLQRPVALKVMKPDVAKNPAAGERFLREARGHRRHQERSRRHHLSGRRGQAGASFLAMEFLEGMSLDDWLKKGRKPTLTQAARIGRQIALGLADAHACGLIHRDIKPGNIWLDSRHQGRVKLLDFGLARGNADEIHLTQIGRHRRHAGVHGAEQARGEHVDHRVDLFSLGVVLYRLTTGQLPFRGDNTMSVLTSLALDTPTPPREVNPDISPRMAALIERLLCEGPRAASGDGESGGRRIGGHRARGDATGGRRAHGQSEPQASARLVRAAQPAHACGSRWLVAASLFLLLGGLGGDHPSHQDARRRNHRSCVSPMAPSCRWSRRRTAPSSPRAPAHWIGSIRRKSRPSSALRTCRRNWSPSWARTAADTRLWCSVSP